MRTTQLRHRATAQVFASCKCKVEIPVQNILLRYALQQASLESSVRAISYRKVADIQFPQVSLTGVVLDRVDGNFLLKVCEKRPERSDDDIAWLACALESSGLRLLERDALDIKREPLASAPERSLTGRASLRMWLSIWRRARSRNITRMC